MGSSVAVTVLFTDLVGSTALGAGRTVYAVEELPSPLRAPPRCGRRHRREARSRTSGDGLMVVFTSRRAAPSPARSACSRPSIATTAAPRTRSPMRIGVAAVRPPRRTVTTSVIRSSRRRGCARRAEGGQILATDVGAGDGRAPRHHRARSRRRRSSSRGSPSRCPPSRCAGRLLRDEDVFPLPRTTGRRRCRRGCSRSLAGRPSAAHRRRPSNGPGTVSSRSCSVGGEPGMGKTSLVAQAACAAHAGAAAVTFGACEEDLGQPYHPWIAALRHLIEHGPAETAGRSAHRSRPVPWRGWCPSCPIASPPCVRRPAAIPSRAFPPARGHRRAARGPVALARRSWSSSTTCNACMPERAIAVLRHAVAASVPLRRHRGRTYRDSELTRGHPVASRLADLRR